MKRPSHPQDITRRDPTTRAGADPAGNVLLVAGAGRISAFPLVGAELVIGRAPECDVSVDHPSLSRRHAVLRLGPPMAVQDLGSTNGTRIGARLVRGGEPVGLVDGAGFHIGPLSFVIVPGRVEEQSWQVSGSDRLTVDDPAADRVSPLVRNVARSGVNVLIQGETGVGKEVLASTLHALSGRSGPFVRVNCAALSDALLESELFGHEKGAFTGAVAARAGLLEAAAGGTVFLDEIGELAPGTQAKLLRAVEAREIIRLGSTRPIAIDARFIAATNRDLPAEVAAERFRQDLYFRLDGVTLRIPPLRARPTMIGPLALQFLHEASARLDREPLAAEPELLAALAAHDWPGNVRELRAVIDRAVLLTRGATIGVRHLAFSPRPAPAAPATPTPTPAPRPAAAVPADDAAGLTAEQRADRDRIIAALETCAGNQTRTARLLGIARTTLVQRIALYRIPRPRA